MRERERKRRNFFSRLSFCSLENDNCVNAMLKMFVTFDKLRERVGKLYIKELYLVRLKETFDDDGKSKEIDVREDLNID